jgi:hypothetical protein
MNAKLFSSITFLVLFSPAFAQNVQNAPASFKSLASDTVGGAPPSGDRDDSHIAAFDLRGMAFEKEGQYQKAIVEFGRSLAINPKDIGTLNHRAYSYANARLYAKAIQDCTRIISLDANSPWAYECRAACEEKLGQTQQAMNDYRAGLHLWNSAFNKITSHPKAPPAVASSIDGKEEKNGSKGLLMPAGNSTETYVTDVVAVNLAKNAPALTADSIASPVALNPSSTVKKPESENPTTSVAAVPARDIYDPTQPGGKLHLSERPAVYGDTNVLISFEYRSATKASEEGGASNSNRRQYIRIDAINRSHTKILKPLKSVSMDLKDNYGNSFFAVGSASPYDSSSGDLYPGKSMTWKVQISQKLIASTETLALAISPGSFGNVKAFVITIPASVQDLEDVADQPKQPGQQTIQKKKTSMMSRIINSLGQSGYPVDETTPYTNTSGLYAQPQSSIDTYSIPTGPITPWKPIPDSSTNQSRPYPDYSLPGWNGTPAQQMQLYGHF